MAAGIRLGRLGGVMYCAVEDVRQAVKVDLLESLLDNSNVDTLEELEAAVRPLIEQAIADAGGEIDGYLAKRYPVPLESPPGSISRIAKDIAVYNLVSRVGVGNDGDREQNYRKRYEDAIRFLELLAKGTVDLGLTPPSKQAAGGFRMDGPERLFSRDSLKGM